MNESQWHSCTGPVPMLDFLRSSGLATERKLRLFVCASTRLLWDWLPPGLMREAVEAGERCAEGAAWEDECERLLAGLYQLFVERDEHSGEEWYSRQSREGRSAWGGAEQAVSSWDGLASPARTSWSLHSAVTGPQQPALLRDIFGDPFNPPPTLDSSLLTWNGGLILNLAQAAYDERLLPSEELHPQRLAVLADALEEAGLADAALLAHLRSPGPHVRGCWTLDCVLQRG